MKKFANALAMAALTALAACGTVNSASVKEAQGAEIPEHSCSRESASADKYNLTINVYEKTMDVLQSSINARFAQLKYSIVKNDKLGIPDQTPKFSCSITHTTADRYTKRIDVYTDRVIIMQSSRNARFAPLKYSIKPVIYGASRTFSHDARLVDGALKELTIVKIGSNYKVTLRTAFYDMRNGQRVDKTEELGSDLKCSFAATKITCMRDDRPVDGVLTEIKLINDHGEWTASLRKAFYDRINGKPSDETNVLVSGLTEKKR